jgi:hypothetical protein
MEQMQQAFAEFQQRHNALCEQMQLLALRFQTLAELMVGKEVCTIDEFLEEFKRLKTKLFEDTYGPPPDPDTEADPPEPSDGADSDVSDDSVDNGESEDVDSPEEPAPGGSDPLP